MPGDKITFGTLDVIFVVDAALNGWQDIYTWMTGLGFPENFDQYANLASQAQRSAGRAQAINTAGVRPPYSDAILNIYTSKNNPSLQFSFKDCFPLALGAVQFDYGQSADEVLTCDAQFRYSYYNFTPTS
ncbi:MAG: hypothetical protein ACREQ5_03475 [Candidatus Dormibacteria bacterium]